MVEHTPEPDWNQSGNQMRHESYSRSFDSQQNERSPLVICQTGFQVAVDERHNVDRRPPPRCWRR